MTNPNTFLELLRQYKVEIPIVQRDYVQGRQEKHNQKVIESILEDFREAILDKSVVNLNFIYGKVENKKFIPLDGQQRLTVLFLLYVFAFRNDDEIKTILKKFTYETRISSRDFLNGLIDNGDSLFDNDNKSSDNIKDALWFHNKWIFDPTIQSSLVVLDKINMKFGDLVNLKKRLQDETKPPIKFDFIPMTEMNMEDELYIKLNARGKPLSNFENYKANLIDQLSKMPPMSFNLRDFEIKLDTTWTDLFWELGNGNEKFDILFRRFFKLATERVAESASDFKEEISAETIENAYYTLEFMTNYRENNLNLKILELLQKDNLSFEERLHFNCMTTFLGAAKSDIENNNFDAWGRIMANLINNTTIERANVYNEALKTVLKLKEQIKDITLYFSKLEEFRLGGFSPEQIKEEIAKSKLFKKGYGEKLTVAEQHPYFTGQIRGAMYLAGLTYDKIDGYSDDDLKDKLDSFEEHWGKIALLFGESKPEVDGYLLRAALLSYGDYTMKSDAYITFCVDNPKEPVSLKALFSSNHNSVISTILKMVYTLKVKSANITITKQGRTI